MWQVDKLPTEPPSEARRLYAILCLQTTNRKLRRDKKMFRIVHPNFKAWPFDNSVRINKGVLGLTYGHESAIKLAFL